MSGLVVLALRILLVVTLYTFLGWSFWILWQDLKLAGDRAHIRNIPSLRVRVRNGDKEPVSYYFTKGEILVGRDPACDVTIIDETVSTRHVKLSFHHGQWWIIDLDSTNGTRINKTPVTVSTVITSGDEIQCGKAVLNISIGGDAIVTPTRRI